MKGKGYEIIGVLDMVVHTYTPPPLEVEAGR